MAVIRRIKNSATVVITFSIATVRGYRPLIGFAEDVEKAWEQLKRKHKVKRKQKQPSLQKNASTSGLARIQQLDNCRVDLVPYPGPRKSSTSSNVTSVFDKFKHLEASEIESRKEDVYNKNYQPKKYSKMDAAYGTPKPGTLSEARAKKASKHIAREMIQLCEVIIDYGKPGKDNRIQITFKDLFQVYTYISDKVVGILLRARKHNMVDFEGEMLFQKRDDHVVISLLLTRDEVKQALVDLQNRKDE